MAAIEERRAADTVATVLSGTSGSTMTLADKVMAGMKSHRRRAAQGDYWQDAHLRSSAWTGSPRLHARPMAANPAPKPTRMAKHSAISITRQPDVRRHLKHPFCYFCGREFEAADAQVTNHDHVPPEKLIVVDDRSNFPLKMKVHLACHKPYSTEDERIIQIIRAGRGEHPKPGQDRTGVEFLQLRDGRMIPYIRNQHLDLNKAFFRYVRGFHAALYDQFLPLNTDRAVHLPMVEFSLDDQEHQIRLFTDREIQHATLGGMFKLSLDDGAEMDAVVTYNGAMIYECMWRLDPEDRAECIFCLRLYDLTDLGPVDLLPRRALLGLYRPVAGIPPKAAHTVPHRTFMPCFDPYA
jgi:hypothetical protein